MMRELIKVRHHEGRIIHWYENRETIGPSYSPALCGARPCNTGWNEDIDQTVAVTCKRCVSRAEKFNEFAPVV